MTTRYGGLLGGEGGIPGAALFKGSTLWPGLLGNPEGHNLSPYFNTAPYSNMLAQYPEPSGQTQLNEMIANAPTPQQIPFGFDQVGIQQPSSQYVDSAGYSIPAQGYWNYGISRTDTPRWIESGPATDPFYWLKYRES